MRTKLQTPAGAKSATSEEFASWDFSNLPPNQCEVLDIKAAFRLMVGPDPFIPGQYGITVKRLDTALTVSFETVPMDDVSDRVRDIIGTLSTLAEPTTRPTQLNHSTEDREP